MRLSVPAIKIAAPVAPVGQAADGSIAVPPLERHNETGWYDRGPTPGEPGPAVIVGHVDTKSGPSVFYDLGKLRPGDRIEVTRADRSVVVFRVDTVEHFDKDRLPADRIYGDDGPARPAPDHLRRRLGGRPHRLRRQRHRLRLPGRLPQP